MFKEIILTEPSRSNSSQTAPTASPTGMNAARLSSLSLPVICATASACCPVIHSYWIIDALFIDLWRASSERSLLFHPPLLHRKLAVGCFFVFASRPPHYLLFCLVSFLCNLKKVAAVYFQTKFTPVPSLISLPPDFKMPWLTLWSLFRKDFHWSRLIIPIL